ncbi:MAG: ribbon-helix-helix protein, CopG family [Actinomycetota bacterium]
MTVRKTYSLPDDLANAIDREATRQGKPSSAIVRESVQQYLASQTSSKLSLWVASKGTKRPVDHENLHDELVTILEKKHPSRKGKARAR